MTSFRVAPHPAVVKLWDESLDLSSPWNETSLQQGGIGSCDAGIHLLPLVINVNSGFHIHDNICRVMWQDIIEKY